MFLWDAPSAASLLAPSFPLIPECPLIHSKVVAPARFLILLMVGLIMLAWLMLAKFSLVCLLLFSLRAFMAHSESVFMWRLAWLGMNISALYIARSSAVVFDCTRFFLTGSALFCGLLGLNHTPMPARASVVPFPEHDLSV